jgi:hypothetical protein
MKKLITTLALSLLFITNLKAQDEDCPVCGWYVDGVKVDSINCYSFENLVLVLPYENEMKNHTKLYMFVSEDLRKAPEGAFAESKIAGNSIDITGASAKSYLYKGYLVYTVFSKATDGDDGKNHAPQQALSRYNLYFDINRVGRKKGKEGRDAVITGGVLSASISGYTKKWDEGCKCERTNPEYTQTKATKEYVLVLKKRMEDGFWANSKVDLQAPCSFPGKKVDVNNLSNASTSSTSQANAPSNTTSSSTTPYSEKHPNGKTKVQGQKNGNGAKEGTWKFFDVNGNLIRTENYTDGIAHGEWKYFKDGKVTKTETYEEGSLKTE